MRRLREAGRQNDGGCTLARRGTVVDATFGSLKWSNRANSPRGFTGAESLYTATPCTVMEITWDGGWVGKGGVGGVGRKVA